MANQFDGDNLIITLEPVVNGVLNINVLENLYEDGKDWYLSHPRNRRVPFPFVSDGGKPLTSIINQGSYIFVDNVSGWRIKPAENDGTYFFVGNLAPLDETLPILKSTDGAFTVGIFGLQPVTQGVVPAMKTQLEGITFGGVVALDAVHGHPGTGYVGDEPIGTHKAPSDNAVDTKAILSARGIEKVVLHGSYTLTNGDDLSGHHIFGENPITTFLTIEAGANVLDAKFSDMFISNSVFDGNTHVSHCGLTNVSGLTGYIEDCILFNDIQIGGSENTYFIDCKSGCIGLGTTDLPKLDMTGLDRHIAFRNFAGPIKIINSTDVANTICFDVVSGADITIDASCTAGKFFIRGVASITNNSSMQVINTAQLDPEQVAEMWQLQGLDSANALTITDNSRAAGSITQTISDDGTTTTVTRTA